MKTKLIFSTAKKEKEQWTDLPFIPRINEWLNLQDILKTEEIATIRQSSENWLGIRGIIKSVEYRHDENDFYVEVYVLCDDYLKCNKNDKHTFQWKFALNLIQLH